MKFVAILKLQILAFFEVYLFENLPIDLRENNSLYALA